MNVHRFDVSSGLVRVLALGALMLVPTLAAGDTGPATASWQTLGLMRVRDMTPFGISRLDMLPAHAVNATRGTFALELNVSYQNTWVASKNVRDFLEARGVERRRLGPEELDAIQALPGDSYLVDGEFGITDLTVHYRVARRFALNCTVPYYSFDGGFLDNTIESFHEAAGFSSADREAVPRDGFLVMGNVNGFHIRLEHAPESRFGDPVVGARFEAVSRPRFRLVLETAVKLAVSSRHPFVTTGHTDYGVQMSLQRILRRNAFYLTMSGVRSQPIDRRLSGTDWIPTMVLGWEGRVTRNTNFILQGYVSKSTVQSTDLDELSASKIQVTAGLQRLYHGYVLRFGVTENVANFDNTPDVGVNLSLGRILFGGR